MLAGCAENVVYQAAVPIDADGWDRTFTPEFAFDVTDTLNRHHLFIDVRHTGEYPFSDLYLFVDLTGPDGRHARDTVQCLLADPTGRWYGKGTGFIFADRYEAHVLYKMNNRFPAAGRYTVKLEQAMRTELIGGVLDVGISLERAQ
jgi:gliding motility-associated lipoprotein GldH